MKSNLKNNINRLLLFMLLVSFAACEDRFLDLENPDTALESSYFKTPAHFRAFANNFYGSLWGWSALGENNFAQAFMLDRGSDLNSYVTDEGRGNITVRNTDRIYTQSYARIRATNVLLEKAATYAGDKAPLAPYVAEAKFFRAYHYFNLLQRFGGVPIITSVPDVDSPELTKPRNSRYEVIFQIINDLEESINDLPKESAIAPSDKGHISKEAAQAMLAKVMVYEATWEKYVGTSTDGDGTDTGAGSEKPQEYPTVAEMLQNAIEMSKEVMSSPSFSLWNHNAQLNNLSTYYLFNLEDAGSNPAGLDKSTNREFILYSKYDYTLRRGNTNISHASYYSTINQKFLDMFVMQDGLPIDKSPMFKGYQNNYEQWHDRDLRLLTIAGPGFDEKSVPRPTTTAVLENGNVNYRNFKFRSYNYPNYRNANTESADFPLIRLAEVYLLYAEALYELNGSITDAQLNESINKLRERAGVAPLTNALATTHGLDMLKEIRRERTVELYLENTRFHDLKRWGIAEQEINQHVFGQVIEGTVYDNNPNLYKKASYQYGEAVYNSGVGPRRAIVLDPATSRNYTRANYLMPIPIEEINLNPDLNQNPGY